MQAEIHIDGIVIEEDLETLRRQLDTLNSVTVEKAALDRVHLTFDPGQVNANMIESAVNAAGADVIRMSTSED